MTEYAFLISILRTLYRDVERHNLLERRRARKHVPLFAEPFEVRIGNRSVNQGQTAGVLLARYVADDDGVQLAEDDGRDANPMPSERIPTSAKPGDFSSAPTA